MTRITARTLTCSLALSGALLASSGCSTAGEGLLSGAGIGALAGLIIGSTVGAAGEGAAIGAAVGGVSGAVIGDQNERNDRYNRATHEYAPANTSYDGYGYRTTTRERRTITRTYRYYDSYAPHSYRPYYYGPYYSRSHGHYGHYSH